MLLSTKGLLAMMPLAKPGVGREYGWRFEVRAKYFFDIKRLGARAHLGCFMRALGGL
jgi:hypothetical protein